MNGKELERFLKFMTPLGEAHIDHVARSLRAAGLLPLGGRGVSAPDLNVEHVVHMLVALAASEKPAEAAQVAFRYFSLAVVGVDGEYVPFPTLGEALVTMIEKVKVANEIRRVKICRSYPSAVIEMIDGRILKYGLADATWGKALGYEVRPSALCFEINGSLISQLAIEMLDDGSDGWVGESNR